MFYLPDRHTALVWIAALSLALNVLALICVVSFCYVAVDFVAHEMYEVKDHALRAMGTGYIPHDPTIEPGGHEPTDDRLEELRKQEAAKRRKAAAKKKDHAALKPRTAGTEITVTPEKCCV